MVAVELLLTFTADIMTTAICLLIALIVVALIARFVNSSAGVPGDIKRVVNLVVALIIVGIALWLINTFIPMAQSIKTILNIVVVVATCVFVLQALGVWNQVVKTSKDMWAHMTAPRPPEPADKAPENAKPSEQH
jgi:predicted membrane protein